MKATIFDIQGFSVQDGPGIRTTVFFKGCPLHCPWCHSPESQAFYPQLSFMSQKCAGTVHCKDRCIKTCPKNAISCGKKNTNAKGEEIQLITVDRNVCDNCGKCADTCIVEALFMSGKEYTVDEVMDIVRRDVSFYDESEGGVTLSGGECMSQPAFVLELLKKLKEENIHTAVDTTGFVQWKHLEAVLPYTDLFLYDIKHMDSGDHKAVTGVPNEIILENAENIAKSGGKMQIRIPVIPGFNSSAANIKKTGEFCLGLGKAVTEIQLLPYHNYGTVKYLRLNDKAVVKEVTPPSDEQMQRYKSLLQDMGLAVTIH